MNQRIDREIAEVSSFFKDSQAAEKTLQKHLVNDKVVLASGETVPFQKFYEEQKKLFERRKRARVSNAVLEAALDDTSTPLFIGGLNLRKPMLSEMDGDPENFSGTVEQAESSLFGKEADWRNYC
ncbi:MAG: hypothetical protein PHD51_04675 [Patescibacteria group bacterium]|nr:hypothetical protein [Patescibacteria group bacterium]MDD5490779.1 hypothetical protein [Patescibacteria group bacterium]